MTPAAARRAVAICGAGWIAVAIATLIRPSSVGLVLVCVGLFPLLAFCGRALDRPFDPFEPVWLAGLIFLFAYGLVPALQLVDPPAFDTLTGYLRLSPPHYVLAACLSGLGFLAFLAGYYVPAGQRLADALTKKVRGGADDVVLVLGIVLFGAGVLAVEAVLRLGDVSRFSPREALSGDLRDAMLRALNGRGYLSIGFLAFTLGSVLLTHVIATRLKARGSRVPLWCPFVAASLVNLVVMAMLLGSRQLAVTALVQLLVVYHFLHRRLSAKVVVITFASLAAFGIAFISLRNSGGVKLDPVGWAGYAAKTFDGFNFLSNAVARVNSLSWGRTFAEDVFWTYLPRSVFAAKPLSFGIVGAQDAIVPGLSAAFGSTASFPPGLLAEGFVNFGVAGVLAVPFVAAALLRTAYEWARKSGSVFAVVVFGYLLGNQSGFFRGMGQVLAALIVVCILLAPLLILPGWMASNRTRWAVGCVLALAAVSVPLGLHPDPALQPVEAESSLGRGTAGIRGADVAAASRGLGPGTELRFVALSASWCEDCRGVDRAVTEITRQSSLGAVRVGLQEASPRRPSARLGQVPDGGAITAGLYGVSELPTVVVLTSGRKVACTISGPASVVALRNAAARADSPGGC